MQDIDYPPFFESLHRPYHQPLKATRWVCEFINSQKVNIKSSEVNLTFYLYLINKLYVIYNKSEVEDYHGVISKFAVDSVYNHLHRLSKTGKKEKILNILRNDRFDEVDKQIYSTYKAASYYVNLSKDKLKLISDNNQLTEYGNNLLSIKSKNNLIKLSSIEKEFYFERLLENDFLLLMTLCLFKGLEFKYKFLDSDNNYFDFVNKMYNIRHFLYNNQSLSNYNKVRSFWLETLDVLDKRNKIRKKYLQIIEANSTLSKWYYEIQDKFTKYEKDNFKSNRNYENLKSQFSENYDKCLTQGKDVLGFVNLYDIKDNLRISHENFQKFLNTFYELEKSKSHIFFSNIVASIDRRKRFIVRGTSVLKIKYKI